MPSPKTFVLIHGGWHGSWVWRDVVPLMRAAGHYVSAPTLTGLGERSHLAHGGINLDTHIEDVIAHIEMEDLHAVTLIGWSYGGIVATGVLSSIPQRIAALIYLDSFIPQNGQALVDFVPAEARLFLDAAKSKGKLLPPLPLSVFGVTNQSTLDFAGPRLRSQPWQSFYQPIKLPADMAKVPTTFIACTGFGETPVTKQLHDILAKGDPAIRTTTIESSHLCMLDAPAETAALLMAA